MDQILVEFKRLVTTLERYLEKHGYDNSGYGVISALGPGFCSESLLVKLKLSLCYIFGYQVMGVPLVKLVEVA